MLCNVADLLIVTEKTEFMQRLLFILTITIICLSCKKDKVPAGEMLEIYLLKSFQVVTGKCQVDAATSTLQDTALVKNQDILEYFRDSHQFTLADSTIQKLKGLNDGTPFAIAIDKQVIYFGILKPSYSSSSCANSITMDYVLPGNKISMNLGYAGTDVNIDDRRNNPKIIATLKDQGKLR
jgi:hypothetical protein